MQLVAEHKTRIKVIDSGGPSLMQMPLIRHDAGCGGILVSSLCLAGSFLVFETHKER